ncbi:MAG TPA: energy-coupling factor ABC transporter substrate-binding protein [Clostridiaceae bacterium]|nr:energy-coupling factor ABC transporter substrate-binding protein [Clostridiaceae bacterium]
MQDDVKKNSKKRSIYINLLLILTVIVLVAMPLYLARNAEFSGTDSQAEEAIGEIAAGYKPWFFPIFEPPSGEVESLLFALQAAAGAGIIGYGLGYLRGRKKGNTEN